MKGKTMRRPSEERDSLEAEYAIRDLLLFPEQDIQPYALSSIEIVPEVESLLQRIVMHRSIASRLALVQMFVGDTPRTRVGSGSCEIFLADVPNWSPGHMVFSPAEPLRILVRNMLEQPLRLTGTVVVGVKELPKFEKVQRRTFGSMMR